MTDNRLKQNIASAFQALVPKTTFEAVRSQVSSVPERRQVTMTVIKSTKTNQFAKAALSVVAACLLLAVGLFGGIYYSNNIAVDSIIDIDVNPSIELTTNKNDRVLSAIAVNHDGDDILDDMDLTKTDLKVAVNAIIGSMVQKGYVVDDHSSILVSVQNKNDRKAQTLRAEVLKDIGDSLGQHNIPAPVINQTVTETDTARQLAEEAGISIGKAVFVQNLAGKDSSLDEKELAGMTISELTDLVNEKGLDIRDIVDYDEDDSIHENIEDTIEDDEDEDETPKTTKKRKTTKKKRKTTTATTEATAKPTKITTAASATKTPSTTAIVSLTPEQAKAKALADAGLTANQVTFTKVKLERDDGVTYFDVEFYTDTAEYDYTIHHTSGAVLEADKDEYVPVSEPTIKKTTKATTTTTKAKPTAHLLSETQAKAAALAHAGLTEGEVTFTKAKLDRDDSTPIYDIEFRAKNVEYDYEIHAVSGRVLEADKDIDDDIPVTTKKRTTTTTTKAAQQLTASQAKAKALAHAGLTEKEVTFIKAKLDRDDGIVYYDVEFFCGNVEYSYEIHAETGRVLEADKDIDDDIPVTTKKRTTTTTKAAQQLTADQAKAKALAHAGLTEKEVTFIKAKLDRDDGIAYYDVEFFCGNVEYSYEIHAETGRVLEADKDINDDIPVTTKKRTTTKAAQQLTADQAKAKALAHAGLTEGEVVGLTAEFDRDDGVAYYEVEFRKDWVEYTYEIDATTGEVLAHEADTDD